MRRPQRPPTPLLAWALARVAAVAVAVAVVLGSAACGSAEPASEDRFGATSAELGTPLASCSEASSSGFAAATRTLTLALDVATTNQIVISGDAGLFRVNGYPCVTAGGSPLKVSDVYRVQVVGTPSSDLVAIDLSLGAFGPVFTGGTALATGFAIDLGSGASDRVDIRGSGAADVITFGTDGTRQFADFTGDARADLVAINVDGLGATGASGTDTLSGQAVVGTRPLTVPASLAVVSGALTPVTLPMSLFGGSGNDRLIGGNGNDLLDGMEGDDTLVASGTDAADGNDTLTGGPGTDTADYGARTGSVYLSIGTSRAAVRAAGAQCDASVAGNAGDDGLYDATGPLECDDVDATVENLVGGSAGDVLVGSTASNVINGGDGSDYLWGGPPGACSATVDVDVLNGGAGDDVFLPLLAGEGTSSDCKDTYSGGAGTDFVLYTFRTAAVTAAPNGAATSGEAGEGDTIASDVEVIGGGGGDDLLAAGPRGSLLLGCAGNDVLTGGAGADTLLGGPGDDLMNGGAGDDRFVEFGAVTRTVAGTFPAGSSLVPPSGFDAAMVGCAAASGTTVANGAGADRMNGGSGVEDTVAYGGPMLGYAGFFLTSNAARTAPVTVTLCVSSATATLAGATPVCSSGTQGGDGEAGENDDVVNVQRVYGGSGDDVLTGAAAAEMLYGYGGSDTLSGGAGADTLVGGAHGNAEANVLVGGADDDICIGEGAGAGASTSGCEISAPPAAPAPVTPAPSVYPSLRVGTWNLKRLGQSTKRLDLVAEVIEANFDVVGLVEVMTTAGVADLIALLPGWTVTLSATSVGANGYFEYYAFLTRTGAATVTSSSIASDPNDAWVREPFVGCFAAPSVDFCLVLTHVVYGSTVGPRDLEIQALATLTANLRAAAPTERDYIVLGDFNRSGSAASYQSFTSIGYRFSDNGLTPTTLGSSGYSNAYDHVLFHATDTSEWKGDAVRVDIVNQVCGGSFSFCSSNLSDHAPFAITLDNTGADDD
jgi:Ca2+-binding RTX toxin-like protein